MQSATIAIHWHDDGHPVYSLDFQTSTPDTRRLATAGGDKNIRVWRVRYAKDRKPQQTSVEYLSTLRKHSQAVNAVRFSPDGQFLASAGDDGMLIIWSLSQTVTHEFGVQDEDMKESWAVHQIHNTNSEVYDICWSPESTHIACGAMDNVARIYSINTGQKITEIASHSHYVQGISWDPMNEYLATQSADRSVCIHNLCWKKDDTNKSLTTHSYPKSMRAEMPATKISERTTAEEAGALKTSFKREVEGTSLAPVLVDHRVAETQAMAKQKLSNPEMMKRSSHLFHSESLQSFYRRLAFSPDGSLLIAPSGIYKYENEKEENLEATEKSTCSNTAFIYIRSGLNQSPVCHLHGLSKPAVAISFSPVKYKPSLVGATPVFTLPYKMVFAVATHDSVIVYDTERLQPLGMSSNLHYLSITDICWDRDGHSIMIASAEGFCSIIMFDIGVFGEHFEAGST